MRTKFGSGLDNLPAKKTRGKAAGPAAAATVKTRGAEARERGRARGGRARGRGGRMSGGDAAAPPVAANAPAPNIADTALDLVPPPFTVAQQAVMAKLAQNDWISWEDFFVIVDGLTARVRSETPTMASANGESDPQPALEALNKSSSSGRKSGHESGDILASIPATSASQAPTTTTTTTDQSKFPTGTCIWRGCGANFFTNVERDLHFTKAHRGAFANLGTRCFWRGCRASFVGGALEAGVAMANHFETAHRLAFGGDGEWACGWEGGAPGDPTCQQPLFGSEAAAAECARSHQSAMWLRFVNNQHNPTMPPKKRVRSEED
ncbi:hypothetical protein GGR56DRAFT_674980 [Xylariaceae sp. FL0804]|nr:hypothetical protein GGR56DRAFT_674980 [Xylariaceae sp. FL0804]